MRTTDDIMEHNAIGLCCEINCSTEEKSYATLVLSDDDDEGRVFLSLLVPLCERHAKIYDDKLLSATATL